MNRIHGTGKQFGASQMVQMVENLPANARDTRDTGLISRLGKSPGERIGNSLPYSCLENSMDRRVWQATVHGVARLDTTVYLCVPAYTRTHTHTHAEWYLKMVQIIHLMLCVFYHNFLSLQRSKLMPYVGPSGHGC